MARVISVRLPDLELRTAASAAEARAKAPGSGAIALDEDLAGDATDELLAELRRADPARRLICVLRERPALARMLKLAGELGVAKILYHPLDRDELAHTIAELTAAPLLPAEPADDTAADLAQIWTEHLPDVLARIGVIESAIVALLEGKLTTQVETDARREAHTLGGTVSLFGFTRAGALARQIEAAFPAGQKDAPRLAQLAVELRSELVAVDTPPRADSGLGDAVVLLLTEDPALGPKLAAALGDRGLRTRISADLAQAERLARRPKLRAVIVDLAMAGGGEAALDIVRRMSLDPDARPVVALAVSDSTEDRLAVARARARSFIERSLNPAEIARDVVALLGDAAGACKVLTVDDDAATVEGIRAMLEPRFEVVTLTDPLRFWEVLEESRPDAVLLDLTMPVVNGIELCRTLRLDPRWARLPVLFLTAQTDRETVARIFSVGADDFVAKPVGEVELSERISNRILRMRAVSEPSTVDQLTGVQTRGFLFARLSERLTAGGRRAACAVVVVRIDGLSALAEQDQGAAGRILARVGALLRSTFRGDDVVARAGDDRFGILIGGFDREGARLRLADLRASLEAERFNGPGGAEIPVTISAGVTVTPADGSDPDVLLRGAEDVALGRAGAVRSGDGPAPVGAAAARPETTVDVVIVDDDRALSNLLVHGLRAHGYTVEWYADGALAGAALGGDEPAVRPGVLLLDVDLPGLDGHSLLRQLARDGILKATRVIMLTLRSNEEEVLMALKSGAFDHVAKPFSMPILIERVRRAMETPR